MGKRKRFSTSATQRKVLEPRNAFQLFAQEIGRLLGEHMGRRIADHSAIEAQNAVDEILGRGANSPGPLDKN